MSWTLTAILGAAWTGLAIVVGVLIGRGIREADRREGPPEDPQ